MQWCRTTADVAKPDKTLDVLLSPPFRHYLVKLGSGALLQLQPDHTTSRASCFSNVESNSKYWHLYLMCAQLGALVKHNSHSPVAPQVGLRPSLCIPASSALPLPRVPLELGHLCSIVLQVSGKISKIYTSPNILFKLTNLPWARRAQFWKQDGFTAASNKPANKPLWTCRHSKCEHTSLPAFSHSPGKLSPPPLIPEPKTPSIRLANTSPTPATLWLLPGAKSFFKTSPFTHLPVCLILGKTIEPCTIEIVLQ